MSLLSFLLRPFRFLWRAIDRIRAERAAEPLNSHPGRVIPDGIPGRLPLAEVPEKLPEPGAIPMGVALRHVFANVPCPENPATPHMGLSTGFFELDDLLHGLQPGRLYVIAGAPAMGKTSFAIALTQQVALRAEKPVLYFSLEVPAGALALQLLCTHARVNANNVRNGRLTEDEYLKLIMAAGAYHSSRVFVDDSPNPDLVELRDRARRTKEKEGIALIVVDYLQKVEAYRAGAEREARQLEIFRIASTLKLIARELDLPVVALAPMGCRGVEYRDDKRPRLCDFRESDACEQEADVIALLYREEYYLPGTPDKGVCEVNVAKNRMGPTGVVRLRFQPEFTRFENLARG